jgi:hypothetical protein
LVAVLVGVGLGVFSTLADGVIPGRLFGLLGNIASPWGLTMSDARPQVEAGGLGFEPRSGLPR